MNTGSFKWLKSIDHVNPGIHMAATVWTINNNEHAFIIKVIN